MPITGIKLDMGAHAHRALRDATLERALASRIDVFDGKAALGGSGLLDRFGDSAFFEVAADP